MNSSILISNGRTILISNGRTRRAMLLFSTKATCFMALLRFVKDCVKVFVRVCVYFKQWQSVLLMYILNYSQSPSATRRHVFA